MSVLKSLLGAATWVVSSLHTILTMTSAAPPSVVDGERQLSAHSSCGSDDEVQDGLDPTPESAAAAQAPEDGLLDGAQSSAETLPDPLMNLLVRVVRANRSEALRIMRARRSPPGSSTVAPRLPSLRSLRSLVGAATTAPTPPIETDSALAEADAEELRPSTGPRRYRFFM